MYSKSTEYGIRAILFLALKTTTDKPLGATAIARELDFPEAFLGKVLQKLVKQNLIVSIKGPGGGFYISKATQNLTILNIIETLEGLDFLCKCGLGLNACNHDNPCPIHNEFELVKDKMRTALSYKTINQLKNEISEGDYSVQFKTS